MRTNSKAGGEECGSVSLDILHQLRRDIVDGRFKPGAKLKFAELQKTYGAGMGTLREALSRLATEGIVTLDAGRGFRVAEVSEEDLRDLLALRIDIERRAIEDSVAHGDDAWEAQVLTTWHLLSKVSGLVFTDRFTPDKAWIRRHRDFHGALVAACRSKRTLQFRTILYDQAERYRLLSIRHGPRLQDTEHEQLKDAALTRNATLAGDLLVKHIVDSADFVLRFAPQLAGANAGAHEISGD
jgi:DNA-binding GntR family transcriptional regulator